MLKHYTFIKKNLQFYQEGKKARINGNYLKYTLNVFYILITLKYLKYYLKSKYNNIIRVSSVHFYF